MPKYKVKSIRSRVLAVLFLTGAIGIIGSFILAMQLERSDQRLYLKNAARSISRSVYELATNGLNSHAFNEIYRASPGFDFSIYRDGVRLFATPGSMNYGSRVSFARIGPSLDVTVIAPKSNPTPLSVEITTVSAIVIVGVLIGAFWVTSIIERAIGGSVKETSRVAQRIESGDLSARLQNTLPSEFDALVSAFDQMAKSLERSDQEQRRFLSDLAHEIATPINAATGLAIAIADKTISEPKEQTEAIELITDEVKRIHFLLEDLRSLDHLEVTKAATQTHFNSIELSHNLKGRFQNRAKEKEISLEISYQPREIAQDKRLIEMIIDNFTSNAIRYSTTKKAVVIEGKRASQNEYSISVTDNGIGIKKENIHKIFDRLYRIDNARDRASGGSGLGLSIARQAALNIGGRIDVESRYQVGSKFTLTFPITINEPELDHQSKPEKLSANQKR
ncbi:HAMP domain-containing sensor histidine kinase [Acidithrix sp. C25]|uniref:sensor histidine kinase n=1 Tax=Acidithrix sp. C25 TaxID=1671482 RepID=UPI00191B97E8|nr:HAMP domain-containing sensor histidine kinase [Acidithrix sp. C25]